MVWQGLVQSVAQIPPVGEVQAGRVDELALGADPLEEHDHVQLKENDRVDARAVPVDVKHPRPFADEAQVELGFEVAVEVVRGDQPLKGETATRWSRRQGLGGPSIGNCLRHRRAGHALPQTW
ncbi:hypothetical protein BH23CHL5_BH23CHL5_22370 [soil metagenome]